MQNNPTQVKLSKTHDRISVKAKFPSGGSIMFSVSRSGERLAVAGSNDPVKSKEQSKAVHAFCQFQGNETNKDRFQRIADALRKANSVGHFVQTLGK